MASKGIAESLRCSQVDEFWVGKVFERAQALEAGGADLIHFEVGRTDFDTPVHIKEAAKAALDAGIVHYTPDEGSMELREAIAAYLERSSGVRYDPKDEILVTVGAGEALFLSMAAYLGDGDTVLAPTPGYPTYWQLPPLFGARANPFICPAEKAFQPDLDSLDPAGARMMLINSPGNPTGAVWSAESLAGLRDYAVQHDLVVVSDETYAGIVFNGEHISPAKLPGMRERTLTLGSFSKTFSMTGWRVGFAAGPRDLLWPVSRLHQHNTVCAPSFVQVGAVSALNGPQEPVAAMGRELQERRDALLAELHDVPGIECLSPAGTFYTFPDISAYGMPSADFAVFLVEKAGVVTVPGDLFGSQGEGHVRMSFAGSLHDIRRGGGRIRAAVKELTA
ncbi:MAG: pyridoxal phosphate-dependent aminotransferase [Thermaerobacterales bacterium]